MVNVRTGAGEEDKGEREEGATATRRREKHGFE